MKNLTIRLDEKIIVKIKSLAKAEGNRSVSSYIRQMVENQLKGKK